MLNSKACCISLYLLATCHPLSAQAEDWQWIPELSVNHRNLSYSAGLTNVSAQLTSADFGMTLTHGRLYLDTSFETDISSSSETAGLAFGRKDATFSLGYGLSDSISAFAGYKYGNTRIELSSDPSVAIRLTGKGPFIGAGAGWQIPQRGLLFFSAAYARLDTRYQDNSVDDSSGKASGTSLSLGWRGRLTERWNYELMLIRHDYYHENFSSLSLNINENIVSFNAGFSYMF